VTATDNATRLARIAGRAASDKLGTDIVLIDVSDRLAITDVFVIVTGNNERQVEAIVDEVEEQLRKVGVKPLRREGKRDGRWVLLDYAEIVVHVQHAEERVFYSLERLWKDCPVIEFDPDSDAEDVSEGQSARVSSSEL
jgi:ribosome-associated protein